jgi:hypothetical protein
MQMITIRVRPMDLSAAMTAMRKWLDERRCEPSNFTLRRSGDTMSICAVFATMLMVRRSKRASRVGHNNGNRIPSLNSWNGCSRTDISDADRAG